MMGLFAGRWCQYTLRVLPVACWASYVWQQ